MTLDRETYDMPPSPDPHDPWAAITGVPCPVEGCDQELVWWEAGYVPGYRACMAPCDGGHDMRTLRHRFALGDTSGERWELIRDDDHD